MVKWTQAEGELVTRTLLGLGDRLAVEAFLARVYGLRASREAEDVCLYGGPESGWLRVRYHRDRPIAAVRITQ